MNDNLHKAKTAKNDEFYTQLCDIEKELSNYPADTFKNKIIYCPCDVGVDGLDVPKSNFVKYFEMNKERFGYKQLLHTSLQEGYDFHSDYCTKLLNEADIVVTNPPFALFRDFVNWLLPYINTKKILILGNKNALTYKEVFPLLRDNKLWIGYTPMGRDLLFSVPKDYEQELVETKKEGSAYKIIKGEILARASAIWFTNLDTTKRHEPLILTKHYNDDAYPKYDNYDAIEVSKTDDIPLDYDGVIGVPISWFDKYCPEQFEIIDINPHFFTVVEQGLPKPKQLTLHSIGAKDPYARILIKRRTN